MRTNLNVSRVQYELERQLVAQLSKQLLVMQLDVLQLPRGTLFFSSALSRTC